METREFTKESEPGKNGAASDVKGFINARIDLLKLELVDKIAITGSSIFSGAVLFVTALFLTIFLSISLAIYLGQWLDNLFYGFAIVTAAYGLLLTVFILFKRPILERPVMNKVVKNFFNHESK